MAVVEDVDAVLVHEGLQLHAHLLVLLEGGVGGVQGVVVAGNHPAQHQRMSDSRSLDTLAHLSSDTMPPMCVYEVADRECCGTG